MAVDSVQAVNTTPAVTMADSTRIEKPSIPESKPDSFSHSEVKVNIGFINDTLSGDIYGVPFKIKHHGHVFKNDALSGEINNKPLSLTMKDSFWGHKTLKGKLSDDDIDLKVREGFFSGCKIKGNFKGKDINITLDDKLVGCKLKGDNMNLRIKNKHIFSNDYKISGTCKEDKELVPILLDVINIRAQQEEMMAAAVLL